MAIIGKFKLKAASGEYIGHIATLSAGEIGCKFRPTNYTSSHAPSYHLVTDGGCELGAAWTQTAEGRSYHSVKLDSPFVSEPAYAALFTTDNEEYNLVWNRDQRNSRR